MNHPGSRLRLRGVDAAAQERFAMFVASRSDGLLRLAFVMTGDAGHAEDVVQTAFARAYARWNRVEKAGNPEAYVRRIVVNAAVDGHRWRARRVPESFGHLPDRPDIAPDLSSTVVSTDAVRELLATLPPRQRAVVALRFLSDLTEAATAAELGISVGAVKSHTSRALARLRASIGSDLEDGYAH